MLKVATDWSQVLKMTIYFWNDWTVAHPELEIQVMCRLPGQKLKLWPSCKPIKHQSTDASLVGCVIASSRCAKSTDKSTKSDESDVQQSEVKFSALQVAEILIFLVSPRSSCSVFLVFEQGSVCMCLYVHLCLSACLRVCSLTHSAPLWPL